MPEIWGPLWREAPPPCYDFEVVNLAAVPREYFTDGWLDIAKIRCAIRDGTRTIPGLRLREEK